jgi:hypothetical protein
MALKMQVLPWDRHKYVVGLNRLMGSQHFPHNHNPINKCLTLPHFCAILKCMVFFSGSEDVEVFYHYFIYIAVGDSIIKREVLTKSLTRRV